MSDPTSTSEKPLVPEKTTSWLVRLAVICSAIVPGLGQVLLRRWGDAALMLLAATWVHGFFAGLADASDRVDAVLWLGFGIPSGLARPTVLVFTVIGLGLHVFAAWATGDAQRPQPWRSTPRGAD